MQRHCYHDRLAKNSTSQNAPENHAFFLVPAQGYVGEFLATFQEFPPRQEAASFSLEQVMEKILTAGGSK